MLQPAGLRGCGSDQGELLLWHHLPWCLQDFSSPSSREHCSCAVSSALLVLLSVLLVFFLLLFFLIFSGFLSGKYSPEYSPKEQWECPAHEICQLQLRCDEQELHSGRASLIPAVGIVSHSALRAVPSWEGGRGMGERGRMWGLLPGTPLASS